MSEQPVEYKIPVAVDKKGKLSALPALRVNTFGGTAIHLKNEAKSAFPEEEEIDHDLALKFYPTKLRQKLESTSIAGITVYKLVAMMFGNGLCYAERDADDNWRKAYKPEVEDFLLNNDVEVSYIIPQFTEYRYFQQTFSEIILSKAANPKIIELHHKSVEHTRVSRQNPKNFNIEYAYYSPEFPSMFKPNLDLIPKRPLLRRLGKIELTKPAYFIHSFWPSAGMTYYARPFWESLTKEGGWIDISATVPQILYALQKNQINIKFFIRVPQSHMETVHPEWNNYTNPQKTDAFNEIIDAIEYKLSDPSGQFSSIAQLVNDMNHFGGGEVRGKIELEAIDNTKIKNDIWIPSSNTADAQIVQGLGLHPSQAGLQPMGGKMGAGSGSDQRESYNTGIELNTIDQKICLRTLNFISQYNGWGVKFYMEHNVHTTTNIKETGIEMPEDSEIPQN